MCTPQRPSLPRGLAHHMALAVASVPHYKLFIFGGQQGGDNRHNKFLKCLPLLLLCCYYY